MVLLSAGNFWATFNAIILSEVYVLLPPYSAPFRNYLLICTWVSEQVSGMWCLKTIQYYLSLHCSINFPQITIIFERNYVTVSHNADS